MISTMTRQVREQGREGSKHVVSQARYVSFFMCKGCCYTTILAPNNNNSGLETCLTLVSSPGKFLFPSFSKVLLNFLLKDFVYGHYTTILVTNDDNERARDA